MLVVSSQPQPTEGCQLNRKSIRSGDAYKTYKHLGKGEDDQVKSLIGRWARRENAKPGALTTVKTSFHCEPTVDVVPRD
ncbi:hypothetical protein NDU88_002148 [Pleurodeles waltl]|uniref:Uncharacterized protein n=1 Tax=Pleurodeles waltl TaxID=8319 RepID=A0AAV7KRC8_PLEWA|nr:hypothetical protein NDU88_002148 [Pleurodeles waltl]